MLEIDNDDVVFDRDQPDGSAIVMTRDVTGLPLRPTKRVSLVSSVSASKYESVVFDAGHNSEPNSDAANRELDLICCLLLIFTALVCHAVYLHSVKTFVLFVNRSVAKPNQIKLHFCASWYEVEQHLFYRDDCDTAMCLSRKGIRANISQFINGDFTEVYAIL